MKLNVALIEENIMSQIKVEICDFNETKFQKIDLSCKENVDKYLVYDYQARSDGEEGNKRKCEDDGVKKRRKRRKIKDEAEDTIILDTSEGLDIVEIDGQKYVTINGVLYTIQVAD